MDEGDSLIFEKGKNISQTNFVPSLDIKGDDLKNIIPENLIRDEIQIPDIPEVEIVRHFVKLSKINYRVSMLY